MNRNSRIKVNLQLQLAQLLATRPDLLDAWKTVYNSWEVFEDTPVGPTSWYLYTEIFKHAKNQTQPDWEKLLELQT